MKSFGEPRFTRAEGETEHQFVHRIRVNGYWKFRDWKGRRWWPSDWGPEPRDADVISIGDRRPEPPPHMPYKD